MNPARNAEFVREFTDPQEFGRTVATARTAHHDQRRTRIVERVQATYGEIGALQRLDAPDEQQHALRVEPEAPACGLLVARREHAVVDTGGHDLDALAIRHVTVDVLP